MVLFLLLGGTLFPLVLLNLSLQSQSAIFLFAIMQLAVTMAILSYVVSKNQIIQHQEKVDSTARYLMNNMLSSQKLSELDFQAQIDFDRRTLLQKLHKGGAENVEDDVNSVEIKRKAIEITKTRIRR